MLSEGSSMLIEGSSDEQKNVRSNRRLALLIVASAALLSVAAVVTCSRVGDVIQTGENQLFKETKQERKQRRKERKERRKAWRERQQKKRDEKNEDGEEDDDESDDNEDENWPVLGGDADEHGCRGSAGQRWCPATETQKGQCRPKREPCELEIEKKEFVVPEEWKRPLLVIDEKEEFVVPDESKRPMPVRTEEMFVVDPMEEQLPEPHGDPIDEMFVVEPPDCSKGCGSTCLVGGDLAGLCDKNGECSFEYGRVEAECEELEMEVPELKRCCRAMTANCLACTAGQTIKEYCDENPTTAGCKPPMEKVGEPTTKEAFYPSMGVGGAGLGPAWARGEIEKPAEEKNYGTYTGLVYSAKQQKRLGVDEHGKKVKPMTRPYKIIGGNTFAPQEKLPYLEVKDKPTFNVEELEIHRVIGADSVQPQEKLPFLEVKDKPTLNVEELEIHRVIGADSVQPQEKLPSLEVKEKPTLKMETLPAMTGGPLLAVAPKPEEESISPKPEEESILG